MAAGLLARNAVAKGLTVKPWVKTSLAPGSQVVEEYLEAAELQKPLDKLGFNIVGYGCTTCIGNSGPLAPEISATIAKHNLVAAAVLSGNRNFEGRVNPDVRANYLASPPLVVAYALAGSMQVDLDQGADRPRQARQAGLSRATSGRPAQEVQDLVDNTITAKMFKTKYASVFDGDANWRKVRAPAGPAYAWDMGSTYVQNPPYFEGMTMTPKPIEDIVDARILGLFLEFDHDRPYFAGGFDPPEQPGGPISARASGSPGRLQPIRHPSRQSRSDDARDLRQHPHQEPDGEGRARRGRRRRLHHPLSLRASGWRSTTRRCDIRARGVPLVVFAGREYGTGSSRDWAAKGTKLLGVRAVIAQSFERIHRSNLVGMGVLPLRVRRGNVLDARWA